MGAVYFLSATKRMAANRRYDNSKNPFYTGDENDIDDDTFLRHSKSGSSGYMFGANDLSREQSDLEEKRLQLLERKRQIEERTLESSNRSIGLLRDSEQIGVTTAEELLRQREQLERTEKRLDEINNTLRFSQKHIQSIKVLLCPACLAMVSLELIKDSCLCPQSVFGSLKNYISGRGATGGEPGTSSTDRPSEISRDNNPLAARLDDLEPTSPSEHPALRIRGVGEEQAYTNRQHSAAIADVNKVLDNNLEEMCSSLTRLRGLAEGLGSEINTQNEMVDRITDKTEKADFTIIRQNKDMSRLLKK
ncbi:hypothetical protein B566_EDAN011761 [Ephemera danica]|nr:hypothetical protein B566_EDAN011761 [Ephemera danica]